MAITDPRTRIIVSTVAHPLISTGAKSLDLAGRVDEFKAICTKWEKYDRELSAVNVVQTRKYVFQLQHRLLCLSLLKQEQLRSS